MAAGSENDGRWAPDPSIVAAVRCAIEAQREIQVRNDGLPADRRIEFRIGIHVGDVIVERDDLLGDGVHLAARLEGIAAASGQGKAPAGGTRPGLFCWAALGGTGGPPSE